MSLVAVSEAQTRLMDEDDEVSAWGRYLFVTRQASSRPDYDILESWAWAVLQSDLEAIRRLRGRS